MPTGPADADIAKVTVALVDDEWMVRSMLRTILGSAPDIAVVAEAGDGSEALDVVRAERPDVVLMDIRMPRMDGLTATAHITGLPSPPAVVVLTTIDLDEYVQEALRNGAVGFLLKDASAEEMVQAVRSAARGDAMLSPRITRRFLHRLTDTPPQPRDEAITRLGPLTEKEREVLVAVGSGLSNAEIAGTLYLSEATVKTHVSRILTKLDMTNRVQIAILAHQAGLLD